MAKKRKFTNIKDVAKKAGVSISTVSFALNNPERVGANTRRHVLRIAKEMNYTRSGGRKKSGYMGLITDDYYNLLFGEFYSLVVFGILDELKKNRINVLVESKGSEPEFFPQMITRGLVDGLLFVGKTSPELIYLAQQKKIPLVLVGHPIPELELPTILPDGRSGAFQAVTHLIELGHKKIAMITGTPQYEPVTTDRVEGYRFALNKAGIPLEEKYLAEADFYHMETVPVAIKKLLELPEPPTAIFCMTDTIAYNAYPAIEAAGLRVPRDISLVGFDNITAWGCAKFPGPELTTIQVDREKMGRDAVKTLFDVIDDPDQTPYRYNLPVQLVVKKTTVPPRK